MLRNLEDVTAWMRDINTKISRILSGAMLENSSITNGRMRFIGGLLRLDTGALLELFGQWRFTGNGSITGDVVAEGKWTQNGDWEFNGDGDIDGDVVISGDVTLTGDMDVTGGGEITAGAIRIDPATGGGSIWFAGHRIFGGATSLQINAFGHQVVFNAGGVTITAGGKSFSVGAAGISPVGLPVATSTTGLEWIARDSSGNLVRVPPGIGGPMGGPLDWPFPESSVTSEYGPRDGGFHEGIDFGQGEGVPIPAAGSGTVIESVTLHSGWGNYVKIDHGGGIQTLYAHMVSPPPVSVGATVARGQIIGNVGNTGQSRGNHLHFEVYVNGVTVNPRTKLP